MRGQASQGGLGKEQLRVQWGHALPVMLNLRTDALQHCYAESECTT